jgi:hypothetical protein
MDDKIFDEIVDTAIDCEEDLDKVENIFKKYNITKYKIDCDQAYDSCGYDVYYYCIAYVYDDKLEMITGTWDCC